MASTDKSAPETEKAVPPPSLASRASPSSLPLADVLLRVLLFAASVTAVVVMVTSKETALAMTPLAPFPVPVPAKFNYSPAFICLVAALSVAGLYSIITILVSLLALSKPSSWTKVLYHFVITDVLLLGIVAAATGSAGGVAYVGLKGNSYVGWNKVCNTHHKFCRHLGASIGVSLVASVVLVLLILLSVKNLVRKIPK